MSPRSETPLIPDHDLIKRIGRGSYGEVWLARTSTGSYRAVKVVYRRTFEADKPYEREFRGIKEFEPICRSHSAQVDILHVGRQDEAGYFYYVMELADDDHDGSAQTDSELTESSAERTASGPQQRESLGSTTGSSTSKPIDPGTYTPKTLRGELKTRGRLPVEECLRMGSALAEALEHLHSHGLVHRDIKPSNVIFVNDRPKLADIGLVARADATLSFVGTEGYLPPEGPGKPQADIYSLGRVFYEMATGKDRNDFPQPPAGIEDSEDHRAFLELNEIILKACENSTDRRYRSATELAGDLRMALQGKSVRRKRVLVRILKTAGRLAAALLFVAIVVFLSVRAFRPTVPREATLSAGITVPVSFSVADLQPLPSQRHHDISPDGKRVLFVKDGRLFLHENDFVRPLFEAQSNQWFYAKLPTWSTDGETMAVVAAPHRDRLVEGQHPAQSVEKLLVGDAGSEKLRPISGSLDGSVRALLWRPDGSGLTIHSGNPNRRWFDIDLDGSIRAWPGLNTLSNMLPASSYSPDGRWVATHDTKDLWVIPAGGGKPHRLTSHIYPETTPTWGDNETLYYVRAESLQLEGSSRLMRLRIDPDSGEPRGIPEPISYSRWGQIVQPKVVDNGRRLMFFESATFNWIEVASYPLDGGDVRRVARGDSPQLSPDGSEVYFIDRTPGRVGIYARPTSGGLEARRIAETASVVDGGFHLSPDGKRLIFAEVEEEEKVRVRIAGTHGGRSRRVFQSSNKPSDLGDLMPRWSPDGEVIAVSCPDRQLRLIDATSGRVRRQAQLSGINHKAPQWSPTGAHIAFIIYDPVPGDDINYRVEVYSLAEGSWKVMVPAGRFSYIETIQWHPDPRRQQVTLMVYDEKGNYQSAFLNRPEIDVLLPQRAEGSHDWRGVWAPDGMSFYFNSEAHEPRQLVHVYHEPTRQIDHEALPDGLPFWSHDGNTMGWVDSDRRTELKVIDLK